MKKFLLHFMLVLGTFLVSMNAANAAVRHRFVYGMTDNKMLASNMAASLAIDPSGRHVINEESCSKWISCATPEDYLDSVAKADPEAAPKTVSQLPAYIASLEVIQAPAGEYWMACKTGNGDRLSMPKWNCMSRTFHPGETCYASRVTHRCVLARDCSNPVGKEVVLSDCIELHVGLKQGDEVHIGWLGADAFPSGKCHFSVKKTGENERSNYDMDECPRDQCDFSGPSRDLNNAKVWDQPRISWKARVTGDNVILLPREVLKARNALVLCVVKPNGRQSLSKIIAGGNAGQMSSTLTKSAFVHDRTYVTYKSIPTSQYIGGPINNWSGKPYYWQFVDGRAE